jgi:hypothetical protein
VNGIEKELAGKAEVVRVNLLSKLGQDIAARFGVTSANTSILLDGTGDVVYNHKGMPDRKRIVAQARQN